MEIDSAPKSDLGPRSRPSGFGDVTVTFTDFAVGKAENCGAKQSFFAYAKATMSLKTKGRGIF